MIKGILIGLGGRAQSWIDVVRRNPNVELIGFVEPVAEQRERVGQKYELPASALFASFEAALDATAGKADFVLDVTPPAVHHKVAMQAFDAGLHVIGEKPLSDDFANAKRTVAAARAAHKTHMITQNYRFGPVPRTAHRLLKSGLIGSPAVVDIGFYRVWAKAPGTHYVTMPYPLITDMGIHHFDLMRYVLAREPLRVTTKTWNPPWGWHAGDAGHTAIFEFEGGLMVTHHALGSSVGKQSPWNGDWRIEGPEGSLTWEEDHLFHTRVLPADNRVRTEIPPDQLPLGGQDAVLAEFVAALSEGRPPECNSEDNLRSLAMVFAAIQSAKEDRTVEIAPLLAD